MNNNCMNAFNDSIFTKISDFIDKTYCEDNLYFWI